MKKLTHYLKELGATGPVRILNGPNGRWISYTIADIKHSMPVGKSASSQSAMLIDMNVLIAEDGQPIATANVYETVDEVEL